MQWLLLILILPYLFMLLRIYRGLGRIIPFHPENRGSQYISVVVASRNEQENLPVLLNDLSAQDYPENLFEVIIVDDNSTDSTLEVASGFKSLKNLKVLKNSGRGKKEAIRTGVLSSAGDLIITTDADCHTGKHWLETISAFFGKYGSDLIVCPVHLEKGKGFFSKCIELEFLSLQGVTAGTILSGNSSMCNGANLAFRKEVYLENQDKLVPEIESGDDIFLLHGIKKVPGSGIDWLESMEASVYTASESSFGGFMKQRKRWIAKAKYYDDGYTITLGIVTFVTILLQVLSVAMALFDYTFIYIYLAIVIAKSIPDYLILKNTTRRYGKSELMAFFLPSQIIYPFYVLITACYAFLIPGKKG
jgi:poly-beta-1,6-N-acetyl-D-glucosamine synthase